MRRALGLLLLPLACTSSPTGGLEPSPDASLQKDARVAVDGSLVEDAAAGGGIDTGVDGVDAGSPPMDGGITPDGGSEDAGAGDAGSPVVPDPEQLGQMTTGSMDATVTIPATGNTFDVHCVLPGSGGPHPGVVLLHGFRIDGALYHRTADHVASFGYVVCVPDYPAGFNPNHLENVADALGTVDWMTQDAPFAGNVDAAEIVAAGHSLGGKLAFLAAAMDPRITGVVGLDPVDAAMLCDPMDCPDATDLLPLQVPTALLGETIDATASFGQACAPADANFQTFFEAGGSPSIEVTLTEANHVSFVDDPDQCGFVCSFCNDAQTDQSDLLPIIRAYFVAFLQRYVKGDARYDEYLTGATAQMRWVMPGHVTLRTK